MQLVCKFETILMMRIFKKYRLRFVIGLAFLMLISACHVQKNTDSDDGTKTTKDKASKKKPPRATCYTMLF